VLLFAVARITGRMQISGLPLSVEQSPLLHRKLRIIPLRCRDWCPVFLMAVFRAHFRPFGSSHFAACRRGRPYPTPPPPYHGGALFRRWIPLPCVLITFFPLADGSPSLTIFSLSSLPFLCCRTFIQTLLAMDSFLLFLLGTRPEPTLKRGIFYFFEFVVMGWGL